MSRDKHTSVLRAAAVGMLLLGSACAGTTGGGSGGGSESEIVARMVDQGFTLVADGRGGDAASALSYDGAPGQAVVCSSGGSRYGATNQSATVTTAAYNATQRGLLQAYVVVENDGALRGLYVNTLDRSVTSPSGAVAAREIETVRFGPGGAGTFSTGMSCRPNL